MSYFRHIRHTLVALFAVLCLFGMQQAAAFHGLTHAIADESAGSQKHLPHSKICDKCVIYAEFTGGTPTISHPAVTVKAAAAVIAPGDSPATPVRRPPVYSARAPPAFL
jgi:hypothetical protein